MSFNLNLQRSCRRRANILEQGQEIFSSLLEPFRLNLLYPGVEKEIRKGVWKTCHEAQPHQQKLHEGLSLSGKRAKAILFNGGVGSGKSFALCVEMIRLLRTYPGIKIVCVDGDTVIEDAPIGDLVQPEYVSTIHGRSEASVPFRRGQADLWRVQMRSGRAISVTEQHRFLTPKGWRSLASLTSGDLIACDDRPHDNCHWGKPKGSAGYCGTDLRHGDGLLSPEAVACLHTLRQMLVLFCRDTSRRPSNYGWQNHGGNSERGSSFGHPLLSGFGELSDGIPEDPLRSHYNSLPLDSEQQSLLSEVASGLSALPIDLLEICFEVLDTLFSDIHRSEGQPCDDFGAAYSQNKSSWDRTCADCFGRALSQCHSYEALSKLSLGLCRGELLPFAECLLQETLGRLLQMVSISYPPNNNDTRIWDEIASIQYTKFGDYFDLSVQNGANYSANGIFNHNCVTGYDYYFTEFLMPTFWQALPEDSPHIKSYNVKDRSLKMVNGSSIRFKAYDDPDKVKGWEAHVIWVEEASELGDGNNDKAFAVWQALLMRLRSSRPAYPLRLYVSQNPKGHNWVWRVFIKPEPGVAEQPLGDAGKETVFAQTAEGTDRSYYEWEKVFPNGDVFYTISTGTSANAYVPAGYVSTMLGGMADSPGLKQRMVEGKFNPINTLVYDYPIYTERSHIIPYGRFLEYWEVDEIPRWWRVVVGIDCGGQRSPWAIEYYVQTEDGHWICFDEIYQAGLEWGQIADMILERSEPYEQVEYWIDPISSNQKSGPTSDTIKDEFQARGIPTKMPRHYNKTGGIMRVQSFLKRDHSVPCPYLDDIMTEGTDVDHLYEIGHSQLYYLSGLPQKRDGKNLEGHACPGNIAEKRVYRYDSSKLRQAKETEEGLSPLVSEKLVDRDDHACTAEMFAFLGIKPLQLPGKSGRQRQVVDPGEPNIMYGRTAKRRGF